MSAEITNFIVARQIDQHNPLATLLRGIYTTAFSWQVLIGQAPRNAKKTLQT